MMLLLRRPPLRIILIGLVMLTIQTTFCATHRIAGVTPNLMLAVSIASGIVAGPEVGALSGFFFGLMFDATLTTPLGLSALTFAICAFVVAVIKDAITVDQAWWLTVLLGFAGSAAAIWLYAVAGTFVGKSDWINAQLINRSLVVGVVSAVLSVPLARLQQWTLCVQRERFGKPNAQPI
jgi:rod shape-determining protein MreD